MELHPRLAFARTCRFIPTPPPERIFLATKDEAGFRDAGCQTAQYLIDQAGLTPESKVLDLGCGIGRTALPLTQFVTAGEYDGLDVARDGILWCQEHITLAYPNFRFHHADVYNNRYNAAGRERAETYRLPFANSRFDLIFAAGLFTHMRPEEVQNYLNEIARILTPNGTLWATWFMVDRGVGAAILERALPGTTGGRIPINWADGEGHYFTDAIRSTNAVAFDEDRIEAMHRTAQLRIARTIRGSWCGRETGAGESVQDIIVVRRTA